MDQPGNGETIAFALPSTTVTLTFVTGAPDSSGTQSRIGVDVPATTTNLFNALRANWFINQLFHISIASGTITLTARVPGEMAIGFTNTPDDDITFTTITIGNNGSIADNYTCNLQLWVEEQWNSGIYNPVPPMQATPDRLNTAAFDLSTLLHPFVNRLPADWPGYNQDVLSVLHNLQRRFRYTYHEQIGDPPIPQKVERSTNAIAWYAGSRNLEVNTIQRVFSHIVRTDTLTPFLTYRSRAGSHIVSPAQQSYLAWYRNVPKILGSQLRLYVRVYYTDGSATFTTAMPDNDSSGWEQGTVAIIPTGFNRLGLHLLEPEKVPDRYTVQVFDHNDTPLSEHYTYHLAQPDYNELHIEYINSLGGFESLRCKGRWVHGIATEHEAVRQWRTLTPGLRPSEQTSDAQALLRGNTTTVEVSTGLMPPGELDACLDILFSPARRLVDHQRQTRAPLIIQDAEYVIAQRGTDAEHLAALNLRLQVDVPEMAWSNILKWPAAPPLPPPDNSGDEIPENE
jgi:hypothetical protein